MEKEESEGKDQAKIFNLEFFKNKFISSFLPTATVPCMQGVSQN